MEHFHKAEDWLLKLSSEAKFFRKNTPPSLEVVQRVLDQLGRPDSFFEWRIVVGGTAGKGTVCRLAEDVLLQEGKTVATLISPHLQVVTERIRINGKLINQEVFGSTLLKIKEVSETLGIIPTYYEAVVLTGILAAKNAGCEILICEVGMGGRLDAVNAVEGKRISALTFIGEDHLEKFGNSIEKLAQEKAGIFTEDCEWGISYEQKMCSIINKISNVKIEYIKGIKSKLNKKLVRKICKYVLRHDTFIMRKIQLPGRWEKINCELRMTNDKLGKNIILDGAHSAPRFEYVLPKLQKISGSKIGIFAMARDHDKNSFSIIQGLFDEIIWTEVPGERGFWSGEELRDTFKRGIIENDPQKAFSLAQSMGGTVLVMGSFYLAGVIRGEFYDLQKILEQGTEFPS